MRKITILVALILQFCSGLYSQSGNLNLSKKDLGNDHLRIVQISDTQLGFTETDPNIDEAYFELAVKKINQLNPQPDVVINTGDLVNNFENPEQWNRYLMVSAKLHAGHFEVMGNHDGCTPQGLADFRKRFGRNDYYSFTKKGCLFIVLDSWYLKMPGENPSEAKNQQQFLIKTLNSNKQAKFKFIVLHHPLYLKSSDENEEYFTLPAGQRKWLLDLAFTNKVKIILTGHYHRNNLTVYRNSVGIITTGPISKPMGFNSDSTNAARGFRIIDINLKTEKTVQEYVLLKENELAVPFNNNQKGFSFLCLGDTHFDYMNHHDLEWVKSTKPADISQINDYTRITKDILPELFKNLSALIHADTSDISFLAHTGDFTEGLCGRKQLAELQMNDFIKFAKTYINIPYLVTKGNHDITGPGADSAYKSVMYPFINNNTQVIVNDSKYVFRKNNAVFFFYDVYSPTSLNWLDEQIKKYKDVRFKFVIMHEPVVPFNARSKWFVFSKPAEQNSRERLLNILGDNHVFVISGHLHKFGILARKTAQGKFLQLSICSVLNNVDQKPVNIRTGLNAYNEELLTLEPGFSPKDSAERAQRLLDEKPFIDYFEYADLSGYSLIQVKNNQVIVDIYSGTGLKKLKSVNLSELMADHLY